MSIRIERVEGYKCTECEELIEEVKILINYRTTMSVGDYLEGGELTSNEFADDLEDIIEVICPECGQPLQ